MDSQSTQTEHSVTLQDLDLTSLSSLEPDEGGEWLYRQLTRHVPIAYFEPFMRRLLAHAPLPNGHTPAASFKAQVRGESNGKAGSGERRDWDEVLSKLPKNRNFKAADVQRIAGPLKPSEVYAATVRWEKAGKISKQQRGEYRRESVSVEE